VLERLAGQIGADRIEPLVDQQLRQLADTRTAGAGQLFVEADGAHHSLRGGRVLWIGRATDRSLEQELLVVI
jgi:hypothetical protein